MTNMRRSTTSTKRIDPALRAAALAAAKKKPVRDRQNPPTKPDDWSDAIVSRSLPGLREKIAQRRTRGPGKKPAKRQVTLRVPDSVLARWKATGPGWQTRMVERLSAP